VEAIHKAHEQTDDRTGLGKFVHGLRELLAQLRALAKEQALVALPVIAAAERPPDIRDVPLRARLLERIVLICIATGREKDAEVAKSVFREFRLARESSNLRRLLGMLQSSGNFLDP